MFEAIMLSAIAGLAGAVLVDAWRPAGRKGTEVTKGTEGAADGAAAKARAAPAGLAALPGRRAGLAGLGYWLAVQRAVQ